MIGETIETVIKETIELKNIEHYIPKVYYENLNKTYLKNIDTFIEENKDKNWLQLLNFLN